MKKSFYRILSVILAIVTLIVSFSGCTGGIIKADASEYLTKGEWFNYFVSEVNLTHSSNIPLDLESDSEYYDSVLSIVDNEIIDADNAVKNLDKTVTKDVVAYTCVNYLPPAYQIKGEQEYDFKDKKEITDVNAANVAVNLNIVAPKSEKKFGATDYVTADDCIIAVEKTIKHFSTYEFKDDNTNIVYNDNVYETNDKIEIVSYKISDFSDNTEDQTDGDVTLAGLKDSSSPEVTNCAKNEDEIIALIPKDVLEANKEAYQKGNIVKISDANINYDSKNFTLRYFKITSDPVLDELTLRTDRPAYRVKGTLPTTDEAIKRIDGNGQEGSQHSTDYAKKIEQIGEKGAEIGPVKITKDSISFNYKASGSKKVDLDNGRSDKTDPTLSADIDLDIKISDIKLTTTGFDTIFKDAIFGKPKASVSFSYKTTIKGNLEIPETRFAPYNNGNGNLKSNLTRSRFTTGKGAADIKVGKFNFTFGPFTAAFRIGLQVHVDGTVSLKVEKVNVNNYKITKAGVSVTQESEKNAKLEAEVNLYAGVELKGSMYLIGFPKTLIFDARIGAGFDIAVSGKLYEMSSEKTETKFTNSYDTNLSGTELKNTFTKNKKNKMRYCVGVKCQFKIYAGAFEEDCIVRKVVRVFNKNFNGLYREMSFAIGSYHFEDGKTVKACTREKDEDGKQKLEAGKKFDISTYNVVVNGNKPSYFYITEIPCKEKNLKKINDGLNVTSNNTEVCNVTYFNDDNKVEVSPVSEGTCIVEISTPAKKYTLAVVVMVNSEKKSGYDIQISDINSNYIQV